MTGVALLVLSISAEATPSERTFSVAGTISKRRGGGKLRPSTLSNLTMLQRITRTSLEGKNRLMRVKRLKPATPPLTTASPAAPPLTTASLTNTVMEIEVMENLSDNFEARLQAEAEQVEVMINAGELAFMVGDQGDLELLEQNLELFTSSDDGIVDESHVLDDDDCSLDNLLSSVNMNQI